jgi:hypothetical protein
MVQRVVLNRVPQLEAQVSLQQRNYAANSWKPMFLLPSMVKSLQTEPTGLTIGSDRASWAMV